MALYNRINNVLYALHTILQASLQKLHQHLCTGQRALLRTDEGHDWQESQVLQMSVLAAYWPSAVAINAKIGASCLPNSMSFCWLPKSKGGACAALTAKEDSPEAISPVVGIRGEGRGQKSCQLCPWGPYRLPPCSPCWETFAG